MTVTCDIYIDNDLFSRPYPDPYDRRAMGPPPGGDPYNRPPPEYYNRDQTQVTG